MLAPLIRIKLPLGRLSIPINLPVRFQSSLTSHLYPRPGDRVIVAMSGGVDSSVCAYLLHKQEYNVEGVYMRNWDTVDEKSVCTGDQDWKDVQNVCKQIGIPCRMINFIKEYWIQVFTKAIDDYARGLTPNPDVMCNREIKFGRLLEKILGSSHNDEDGIWMATGHYAQREVAPCGKIKLLRAVDSTKDQTYYLSTVPEEKLQRTIFPIGHLTKLQVRQIANEANLIIANKAESMGLCFVGEKNKFADFLGEWFVYQKDVENNSIIVVPGSTNILLFSRKLVARDWVWCWNKPPDGIEKGIDLLGQVRYRQVAEPCKVTMRSDFKYLVEFSVPIQAVAPGQYVAVWDGNWCLGGGVIEESLRDFDESDKITLTDSDQS
ncbi:5760_t:CDS:10 [Paraglomus brasilianum]|uniref:tRNA-5-taurinomethyluridine 2-sulfurtransferase n=1 Tax=Paraglomus brasilianum TaxID=144538 RepID=A0A9N9B147_9GLOM|nr:5760_t:CDS:10 [Paraglomus brasilianum]